MVKNAEKYAEEDRRRKVRWLLRHLTACSPPAGCCHCVPLTVLTLKELQILIPTALSRGPVWLPGYLLASLYPV